MTIREKRNRRIKQQVMRELELGLSLREACEVVGERWYLSGRSVERIYYETIMVGGEVAKGTA